jgi:O-antigen ligase
MIVRIDGNGETNVELQDLMTFAPFLPKPTSRADAGMISAGVRQARSFVAAAPFLFGLIVMPLGSAATALYFAMALIGLYLFAKRQLDFALTGAARFVSIVAILYFAIELLSPLLFPNAMMGWKRLGNSAHFLVFPIVAAVLIQTASNQALARFLNGLRFGAIAGFLVAFVQVQFLGIGRAYAGVGNAIPYGDIALLSAGMSLIGFGALNPRTKGLAIAAAIAGVGGCALSGTRGAFIAVPFILMGLAVPLFSLQVKRIRSMAVFAFASVACIAVVSPFLIQQPRIQPYLLSAGDIEGVVAKDQSVRERLVMLEHGAAAFLERPILGYGIQNRVTEVIGRASAEGVTLPNYSHLHNEFVTQAVGKGLIGVFSFVIVLATPLLICKIAPPARRKPELLSVAIMLSGSYLAFGLTNMAFGHDLVNSFFLAVLAFMLCAFVPDETADQVQAEPPRPNSL